jgi:large subunit ribosomal protein L10
MIKKEVKPEKKKKVEELKAALKKSSSVALVDYSGMDVKSQQELKRKLKAVGGKMVVVKNTLIKIAGGQAKLPEEVLSDKVLVGQTAVVLSDKDPVAAVQVLGKVMEETERPEFKAGVVEGVFQDKEGLIKIAKLPSKEELVGQMVGAIASPMYGLMGVLQGNMQKLVYILKAGGEENG